MSRSKLFQLALAMACAFVFTAQAAILVPEATSPAACGHDKNCKRWFQLSEKQNPNACKYEAKCRRWYSVGQPVPEKITLLGVNFDTASAKIRAESYSILDENVGKLQKSPSTNIRIVGHTDNRGGDAYNQKLSDDRANSVLNYFVGKGISASRMSSSGRGESEPAAPNDSADNMFKNRRIEIYID